jgi:hypothetical protein
MNDRIHNAQKKSLHKGSRAARLLIEIGQTISDVHFGLLRPGLVVKFGIDGAHNFINRREVYLRKIEMARLEKRGIIQRAKVADGYWVAFSKQGLEEYLIQMAIKADALPNGKICICSFGIPEDHATLRNYIRRLLRILGFEQTQKSVWSCKKDVFECVKRLFNSKFCDNGWIRVYLANYS